MKYNVGVSRESKYLRVYFQAHRKRINSLHSLGIEELATIYVLTYNYDLDGAIH